MLLDEVDVGHQRRAGVAALEKIVAEDQVLREAPADGLREGVHVVDALADERALAEEILVDVGDLPRVGIDARFARRTGA